MLAGLIGSNKGGSSEMKKDQLMNMFSTQVGVMDVQNLMVDVMMTDMMMLTEKYKFPSKILNAKKHLKGRRYGHNPPLNRNEKNVICPCC